MIHINIKNVRSEFCFNMIQRLFACIYFANLIRKGNWPRLTFTSIIKTTALFFLIIVYLNFVKKLSISIEIGEIITKLLIFSYAVSITIRSLSSRNFQLLPNFFRLAPIKPINRFFMVYSKNLISSFYLGFNLLILIIYFTMIHPSRLVTPTWIWLCNSLLFLLLMEMILLVFRYIMLSRSLQIYIYLSLCLLFIDLFLFFFLFEKEYSSLPGLFDTTTLIYLAIINILLFLLIYYLLIKNRINYENCTSFHFWGLFRINTPTHGMISLHIALLTRNKLIKKMMLSGIILLLGGIISIAVNPTFDRVDKSLLLYGFIILSCSGYIFVASYGQNIFGWDSFHLGFIFSKNISLLSYINSKIYLIRVIWFAIGIINFLVLIIFSAWKNYGFLVFVIFYYSIVMPYAFLFQSLYAFDPLHPNYANIEDRHVIKNYYSALPASLPFILIITEKSITGESLYIGLYSSYILSLLGFLCYCLEDKIKNHLINVTRINKYTMIGASSYDHDQ